MCVCLMVSVLLYIKTEIEGSTKVDNDWTMRSSYWNYEDTS